MVVEARFMIDLAVELGAPAIRVFGGALANDQSVDDVLLQAADILLTFYQACQDRTHKRYLSAVESLAHVRRLLRAGPLVAQVNIAQPGAQQLYVCAKCVRADNGEDKAADSVAGGADVSEQGSRSGITAHGRSCEQDVRVGAATVRGRRAPPAPENVPDFSKWGVDCL
jgi:hypothetical protein